MKSEDSFVELVFSFHKHAVAGSNSGHKDCLARAFSHGAISQAQSCFFEKGAVVGTQGSEIQLDETSREPQRSTCLLSGSSKV